MPQVYIKSLPDDYAVGLYHITENLEYLQYDLPLTRKERELFATYTHPEKKLEWCAARKLIRHMVSQYGLNYEGMRKDDNGKPWLINASMEISISHSFPYVCAIMHPSLAVGIDLEQPKEKLVRIGPRYLNDTEIEITGSNLNRLCTFWCAKEALYKIHSKRGLIFKTNIIVEPEGYYPWNKLKGTILAPDTLTYTLHVSFGENYIMVHNA